MRKPDQDDTGALLAVLLCAMTCRGVDRAAMEEMATLGELTTPNDRLAKSGHLPLIWVDGEPITTAGDAHGHHGRTNVRFESGEQAEKCIQAVYLAIRRVYGADEKELFAGTPIDEAERQRMTALADTVYIGPKPPGGERLQ